MTGYKESLSGEKLLPHQMTRREFDRILATIPFISTNPSLLVPTGAENADVIVPIYNPEFSRFISRFSPLQTAIAQDGLDTIFTKDGSADVGGEVLEGLVKAVESRNFGLVSELVSQFYKTCCLWVNDDKKLREMCLDPSYALGKIAEFRRQHPQDKEGFRKLYEALCDKTGVNWGACQYAIYRIIAQPDHVDEEWLPDIKDAMPIATRQILRICADQRLETLQYVQESFGDDVQKLEKSISAGIEKGKMLADKEIQAQTENDYRENLGDVGETALSRYRLVKRLYPDDPYYSKLTLNDFTASSKRKIA